MSADAQSGQESAFAFGNALLQVLRLLRLYETDNVAYSQPLQTLREVLEQTIARAGSLRVQAEEGMIYFNREAMRGGRQSFGVIQGLVGAMEALGLAELAFTDALSDADLRLLFSMFRQAQGNDQEGVRILQAALDMSALKGRVLAYAKGETTAKAVVRHVQIDEKTYFPLAYARTLVLLREYVKNMGDEELNRYFTQKLHRAIQEIVGLAVKPKYFNRFLALALVRDTDDLLFTHMAATGMLSILLGHRLGLSHTKLGDLGLAAMLSGLGLFRSDPGLIGRENLDPAERMELGLHPYRALACYLEGRKITPKMLVCSTVGFQYDLGGGSTPLRVPPVELHPYVAIVRVCDRFTWLTTELSDRPALLPDAALRQLIEAKPGTFDPLVMTVFVNMMGLYPSGSVVALSTGEVAVVVQPNPDRPKRPLVAIVLDAEGRDVAGEFLDLADPECRSTITGSVDPRELGIKVPEFM